MKMTVNKGVRGEEEPSLPGDGTIASGARGGVSDDASFRNDCSDSGPVEARPSEATGAVAHRSCAAADRWTRANFSSGLASGIIGSVGVQWCYQARRSDTALATYDSRNSTW
jgi:hypothetical protein